MKFVSALDLLKEDAKKAEQKRKQQGSKSTKKNTSSQGAGSSSFYKKESARETLNKQAITGMQAAAKRKKAQKETQKKAGDRYRIQPETPFTSVMPDALSRLPTSQISKMPDPASPTSGINSPRSILDRRAKLDKLDESITRDTIEGSLPKVLREDLDKVAGERRKRHIEEAKASLKNATDRRGKIGAAEKLRNAQTPLTVFETRKLDYTDQRAVQAAKEKWNLGEEYRAKGDTETADRLQTEAHQEAEAIRHRAGFSGGSEGADYLTPELKGKGELLNKEASLAVRSMMLQRQDARDRGDVAAAQDLTAQIQDILNTEAYYDPEKFRAYQNREPTVKRTDAYGREIYTPTSLEMEGQRNFFPAIGNQVAGSFASLGETLHQATRNTLSNRNDSAYQSAKASYEYWTREAKNAEDEAARQQAEENAAAAKARMEETRDETPVDRGSWGQRTLRKAARQQEKVLDSIDSPAGKLLAQAGMSAIGMAPALAASAVASPLAGAALMGAQAAGGKAGELGSRGISAQEALARGALSGAIEGVTEKIPISNLVKMVRGAGGAKFLRNVARQAGIEATEESASYALNALADKAAQDPEAIFSLQELAENAAIGAISGAGFGAVGAGLSGGVSTTGRNTPGGPGRQDVAQTAENPLLRTVQETQREREQATRIGPEASGESLTGFERANEESNLAQVEARIPSGNLSDTVSSFADRIQEEAGEVNRNEDSVGAARGGFDPYSRMLNEYGAIPPGENPARLVDVPRSTDGQDRVRQSARTFMEAEATPEELVEEFQTGVVNKEWSYNQKTDQHSVERAAKLLGGENGYAKGLAQWDEMVQSNRMPTKDDIVMAEMLYKAAAKAGELDLAKELAAEIAAYGTLSGQNVQALRLLKKATPEGKLFYIQKTVDRLNEDLRTKKNWPGDIVVPDELQQKLVNADSQEAQNAAIDAIYNYVAERIPRTTGMRLDAWRYFAMLGNPRTHIRNVIGNVMMQGLLKSRNTLSTALQRAALPQEQRTRGIGASRAAKEFAKKDFAENKDILRGNPYTNTESSEIMRRVREKAFTVDETRKESSAFWRTVNTLMKPVQAGASFNSRMMDAEDMIFKRSTYINSMANFLEARGYDPATQEIPLEVLEAARGHAIEDALESTFQDYSAFANKLAEIENSNKVAKFLIGGSVPFKKTPINIAKRGMEFSPAGLVKGLDDYFRRVKKGDITAAEAIDKLSAGLTGTGIMALGAFLAARGVINAGDEEDDRLRDFGITQGSQEYSLNLGDYTYTIDWAAPSVIPLFMGVEAYNAIQRLREEEKGTEEESGGPLTETFDVVSRLLEPMLNMTMLSGVSGAIKSSAYNQADPLFGIVSTLGQNYLGQLAPSVLAAAARTADDTRRTTFYDQTKDVPEELQTFLQSQMNKIPGLSQRNPAYLDSWGRPDVTENPLLRAFENFLSPGYISKRNTDSVDAELERLYALGEKGVLPKNPEKSAQIDDKYLTADQYQTYATTKGREAHKVLEGIFNSSEYRKLSDTAKADFVRKAFEFGNYSGKEAVGADTSEWDSWYQNAKQAQEEAELPASKFLELYTQKSAIDKNYEDYESSIKQGLFEEHVDAREDLTDDQKAYIKENIKFWNMNPADSGSYEKAKNAGYETTEEIQQLLETKRTFNTDGNTNYSTLELYDGIASTTEDPAEREKMWNALKDSSSTKNWREVEKEYAPISARVKNRKATVDKVVSTEKQEAFAAAVEEYGAGSRYAVYKAITSVQGATFAEQKAYYDYVSAKRPKPWKASWSQMLANGGYPS